METLILNYEDVQKVFSIRDCVESVELAFKALGENRGRSPVGIWHKQKNDKAMIGLLLGYEEDSKVIAIKNLTVNWNNPEKRNIPHTQGVIILYDSVSGFPCAIIEGIIVTYARTGADAAIAAKYLANKGIQKVGIMGARDLARYALESAHVIYPTIKTVLVYSRTSANANRFAESLSKKLGIEIEPVSSPKEVVQRSEIVITGTTSPEPLIRNEWVEDGLHISWMGNKMELDWKILERAKVVSTLRGSGKISDALKNNEIAYSPICADIGEIVTGKKVARTSNTDVTLYESVAAGLLDAAVAKSVFEAAKKANVGTWFEVHKGAPAW